VNPGRIPGVMLGVVTSTPDEQGRVEVQFRVLGEHRRPRAPIATPLAGGERGLYFMPEVGDDVLVAFDQGDFDHPFIVGCLWDGVERPPETDYQNRVIVTPGGHQLRFEDGTGKVVLQSAAGNLVEIDDRSGEITIRASSKVTLAAPQIDLTAEASQSVVFGEVLKAHLEAIAATYASHVHLVFGLFPVTPPIPPALPPTPPDLLSTRVKTG
jgi:phage baseplate assembly protein V